MILFKQQKEDLEESNPIFASYLEVSFSGLTKCKQRTLCSGFVSEFGPTLLALSLVSWFFLSGLCFASIFDLCNCILSSDKLDSFHVRFSGKNYSVWLSLTLFSI